MMHDSKFETMEQDILNYYHLNQAINAQIVQTPWIPESPKNKQIDGNHYKNMAIQPIDFIVKNNIPWHEGNAIKYIVRHKYKNGKKDLEKAIHYLEMLIEECYPNG